MTENRKHIEVLLDVNNVIIEKPESFVSCILKATSIAYNIECVNRKYKSKDEIEGDVIEELVRAFTREVFSNILGGIFKSKKYNKQYKYSKEILKKGNIAIGIQEYISDFFDVDCYIIIPLKGGVRLDISKEQHSYYHKNRDSIFLLYEEGKYCLISVFDDESIYSIFDSSSEIVTQLKNFDL